MKQESHLLEEIKLIYKPKAKNLPKISSSIDAANYIRPAYEENIAYFESFIVIYLNQGNKALGWRRVSTGGIAGTLADKRLILQTALLVNAVGMILTHNHPSGNLKPSQADLRLTRSIAQAGRIMEVNVLDHIILTPEHHYSFADEGRLPTV